MGIHNAMLYPQSAPDGLEVHRRHMMPSIHGAVIGTICRNLNNMPLARASAATHAHGLIQQTTAMCFGR
jgi:hypothetical protein